MTLKQWASQRCRIQSCPCAIHTCLRPHLQVRNMQTLLDFRKLYFKTDLNVCLLMYFYIPPRVLSVLINHKDETITVTVILALCQ